jgi:hypothetical protein
MSVPPIPHIPDELQKGVSVVVQTKYGPVKGGRTTNGASVFLGEVVKQILRTHMLNQVPRGALRATSRSFSGPKASTSWLSI